MTRYFPCIRLLSLLLLAGFLSCSATQDEEVQIGRENAVKVESQLPIIRDQAIAGYVQALGDRIASRTSRADLQWRFAVVNSHDVNAFALPGGFIYVNRGLIERTTRMDELAGALGHEIGHVVQRHSMEQMAKGGKANVAIGLTCSVTGWCDNGVAQAAIKMGGAALFARYSREDEMEADADAVNNVVRAGIDPRGIPELFATLMAERRTAPLAIESFFASHPLEENRMRDTERQIQSLDPALLSGLISSDETYDRFLARLRALP